MDTIALSCVFSQLQNFQRGNELWLVHGTRAKARTQLAQHSNQALKQNKKTSEARVLRRPRCTLALRQSTTRRRVEGRSEHCTLTWKPATRLDQFHAVSLQGFPAQISLLRPPEVVGCLENRKLTEAPEPPCASILTLVVKYNKTRSCYKESDLTPGK